MQRFVASAIVLLAASGCSSGQNTDCRWPEEAPRQLDLRSDADADHLMKDVELAEELSVRFADNSGAGPGPRRQRLRLEKCFEPLTAGIVDRHGVSIADVLDAQARIGHRGLNLVVNVPVVIFFAAVTTLVLRRVRRRFAGEDEIGAIAVASVISAVAVAVLTTGFGRVWQMIAETIRLGNGHLGGQRGLRLPWVQHSFEYFAALLIAFLVIAVIYNVRVTRAAHKALIVLMMVACVPLGCGRADAPDMTFFVTSTPLGDGGNLGGIDAADAHCQKLAEAAGAGGHVWRAYLSAAASDGKAAVNARDRIGNGPWHNARGVLIAANLDALHGAGNHIGFTTSRHENGEPARAFHDMLTGSDPDGTLAEGDATCRNWTSTTGHAVLGHSDKQGPGPTGSSWNSAHLSDGCTRAEFNQSNGNGLFYCFAMK